MQAKGDRELIHEIAALMIDPAKSDDFEAAATAARPNFEAAQGFRSFSLERSMDSPGRYYLIVGWDRIEDHMVGFRSSDGFQAWRNLASPFFTAPPQVNHIAKAI